MPEGPPAAVTTEAPMTDDDQVPARHYQGGSIFKLPGPIIVAVISGANFLGLTSWTNHLATRVQAL